MSRSLQERLDTRTKADPETGCLIWQGYTNDKGYGRVKVNGRMTLVHRATWELAHGLIPDGLCILHDCDNPPCRNIQHLFLGTQLENIEDMKSKKRQRKAQGEINSNVKLTAVQVSEIRTRYAAGGILQRQLAEEFGVVDSQISQIITGKRWTPATKEALNV